MDIPLLDLLDAATIQFTFTFHSSVGLGISKPFKLKKKKVYINKFGCYR